MSATSEPTRTVREGDRVAAKVLRVLSSGVIVELGAGKEGIVRNRELSWDQPAEEAKRAISAGKEIQAIVLRTDTEDKRIELSLRQALADPWTNVARGAYRVGSIVSGHVVNFESYGAFVELERGIVGLLHKSAIPGGQDKEIEELLWIGDHIKAVVTKIDLQKRRIGLSIVDLLERRRLERQPHGVGFETQRVVTIGRRTDQRAGRATGRDFAQRVRQVLVVDDEQDFADSFAEWLRLLGYACRPVYSGQEALSDHNPCDLLFLDVELPDLNGVEVARTTLSRSPAPEVVLLTGRAWLEQNIPVPEDLEVTAVLLKPLDYGEVKNLLLELEENARPRVVLRGSALQSRDQEFLDRIAAPLETSRDLREGLREALAALRDETGARAAAVFELDPLTQVVSIPAAASLDVSDIDRKVLHALRFSPVKEVALEGERIVEEDTSSSRRFDRLFELLRFDSCIAVPIPETGAGTKHALFLFDLDPDRSTQSCLERALSVAYVLSAAIREDRVNGLARELQSSILIGRLASSLLHELRNKVNVVEQQARILELDCEDMADNPKAMPLHVRAERLYRRVVNVLAANGRLRDLILEYLGLMGKEETVPVAINDLLQKTMRQIGPLARDSHVQVDARLDPRSPRTLTVPLRLEQAFLNVALNAVQQMQAQGVHNGALQITSRYDPRDRELPIKVRFADEGPGIHRKRWDWIFEMGTSTREKGTGLGLFVSKGLLESLGGRISVEESYMYVGSTFLIELPLTPVEEVAHA